MNENHADEVAAHGGIRATLERMKGFWWPTMADDVHDFVKSCTICQARKAVRARTPGEMESFVTTHPMQMLAVDCLGPLPASIRQKEHVIVAVDVFTRLIEAKAVKNIQGATCARFLATVFARFGAPKCLVSDNAPSFCNQHVNRLISRYKIEHRKAAASHHTGNAMVERVIQSLQEKLSLITHDPASASNWESALPVAIFSLNSTTHSSTGFSGFELMFGRRQNVLSEIVTEDDNVYSNFDELRELRMSKIHAETVALQSDARLRSKQYFDARHRKQSFEVGELVLIKESERRGKLQNRYISQPFRVLKRESHIYTLEGPDEQILIRHTESLKPFIQPNNQLYPNNQDNSLVLDNLNDSMHTATIKSIFIIALISAPGQTFERAKQPVIWTKSRVYVSPTLTKFQLSMKWAPP